MTVIYAHVPFRDLSLKRPMKYGGTSPSVHKSERRMSSQMSLLEEDHAYKNPGLEMSEACAAGPSC